MQDIITQIIEKFGYLGVFLLITLENIFPPIPSEVILTFGGFMTTQSNLDILGVIISSTLGSVAGALILYGIGRALGVNRIQKLVRSFGKILRLRTGDVTSAVRFYDKHKKGTVFFCRLIPILRSLISVPAGMAGMNLAAFTLLTAAGSLIWNCVLTLAGSALGSSWHLVLGYMDYFSLAVYIGIGAAVILFIGYSLAKRLPKYPKILGGSPALESIKSRANKIAASGYGAANIDGILEEFILSETGKKRRIIRGFGELQEQVGKEVLTLKLEEFLSAYESFIDRHENFARAAAYLPENYCRALLVKITGLKSGCTKDLLKQTLSCYYKIWLSGAVDKPSEDFPALISALDGGNASLYSKEIEKLAAKYADAGRINANISGDISKMDFGKALLLLSADGTESGFIPDDGTTRYSYPAAKKGRNFFTLNLIRNNSALLAECRTESGKSERAEALKNLIGVSPASEQTSSA